MIACRDLRKPDEASGAKAAQMMAPLVVFIRTPAAIAECPARIARQASMLADRAMAEVGAAAEAVIDNVVKVPLHKPASMRRRGR